MSTLLTYIFFLVCLFGSCTPQDTQDLILLTLENLAQKQDRLISIVQKNDESIKALEERIIGLKVEEIHAELDSIKTMFLTEQGGMRTSNQQCSTKDQLTTFQNLITQDECEEGSAYCSVLAICTDAIGQYTCVCMQGYSGDGFTCGDIDECNTSDAICGEGSTCINHPGTYGCLCHDGFIEVNNFCTDLDECSENSNVCGDEQICSNFIGNFSCTCHEGYEKEGDNCQDIDECNTKDAICGERRTCINHPGTYGCLCSDGFIEVNNLCTDVDECSEISNVCGYDQICSNLPGTFSCTCHEGYETKGNNQDPLRGFLFGVGNNCQDINECASDVHLCSANATCNNIKGNYTCQCLPYYYGDGFTCNDCQTELNKERKLLLDTVNSEMDDLTYATEEILWKSLEQKEPQCRKPTGSNCKELLDNGWTASTVYTITPEGFPDGVEVYCDQETDGGGWSVIFQRKRQTQQQLSFVRTFEEYAAGFGDPNGEIWIGNRVVHSMTGDERFTLRVDAKNLQGESRTGIWRIFRLGSEDTQFRLSVAGYSSDSTLGDGLSGISDPANGNKFSTYDRDNDKDSSRDCSGLFGKGGWWYDDCLDCNPTAPFGDYNGKMETANWQLWEKGSYKNTAISEIQFKIRPKSQ